MKKFFTLIILSSLIFSCGRKGPMEYPGGQKRPNFSKVYDKGNV